MKVCKYKVVMATCLHNNSSMKTVRAVSNRVRKLRHKLKKLRLRPISVFLFHQVSDEFDETTMKRGDWTETNQFKHNIEVLKKEYTFIPLEKAYAKMKKDKVRLRNFAVLTSDDGWASLENILPWLKEQKIPVTLFLNPGYFDGEHFREKPTERYLLKADVDRISHDYPAVTFGLHGWEHIRATEQTEDEFRESVLKTLKALQAYPNFVPYFAYTYGNFGAVHNRILNEFDLVPVLIDKEKNVDDSSCIHRELLDGMKL